jgi:hypothetical protein
MSDIDWKLVKPNDLQLVWVQIAPAISKLLFRGQLFVCSNITDANYYDLMVCFFKDSRQSFLDKLGNAKLYHLLGHVSDCVKVLY